MIKRSVLSLGALAAWLLIAAAFAQPLWELGLLLTRAPRCLIVWSFQQCCWRSLWDSLPWRRD